MNEYKITRNSQFGKIIKTIISNCNNEELREWMKYLSESGDYYFKKTIVSYFVNDARFQEIKKETIEEDKNFRTLKKNSFSNIYRKND